jgi:hypothetical protein
MVAKLRLIVIVINLLPYVLAAQGEVRFTASSKPVVELGEQFRITYELNAEGSRFTGPDFDGLRVVTGPMTSSSSSIQIVGGQMSRTFNQTYTYVVVATREGDINLGPASIMVEGAQYKSNTLQIKVQAAGAQSPATPQTRPQQQQTPSADGTITDKDLFIRAIVDKREAMVGEQIIITYRLFTKVPVANITVHKLSSFPGFWVKNLLDDRAPLQQSTQVIDGEEYVVADLRKMAIFPQRSGRITIEAMEIEGTAQVRVQPDQRRVRDPFESFFSDPFFNRNIRNIQRTLVSNPIEIEVSALPFAGRPQDYGGAVGQFSLQSAIDRTELSTNEAVSVSYTINGSGNIELIDFPTPAFPPDFEVFEPKITTQARTSASGVSGIRKIEYLLIPRSPGKYKIPAVNFSYFDPRRKAYVALQSDSFELQVERGIGDDGSTAIGIRAQEGIRYLGQDIRYIKINDYKLRPVGSFFFFSQSYFIIIIASLIVFFATLIYFRKNARLRKNQSLMRTRQATKAARKRLRNAHKHLNIKNQNEFYVEMSQALWGYISDKFNIVKAELSIESVREALVEKNVPEEIMDRFVETLNNCEFARFAPGDASEKMEDLYKQGIDVITRTERIIK